MALTKVSSGLISADASSVDLNIDAGTLYIDATNNRVGIGTSVPAAYLGFDAGAYQNGTEDSSSIRWNDVGTADSILQGYTIGTDGANLWVGANSYVDSGGGVVAFDTAKKSSYISVSSYIGGLAFGSAASGNPTERMRIDSSGNVGIGTSSPASGVGSPLTLTSTSTGYVGLRLNGTGLYANDWDLYASGDGAGLDIFGIFDRTNTTYRLVVTNTGNVGIGTTTPSSLLHIVKPSGNPTYLQIAQAGIESWQIGMASNSSALAFLNSGSERMRVDNVGNLLWANTGGVSSSQSGIVFNNTIHSYIQVSGGSDTNFRYRMEFINGNGTVGTITTSGSATAYNTSSDYRLKENVVEMGGAIDRVKLLQPKRFNFIADADKTVDGFLAHEVQDIVPEAIHGVKDEVDEEGNPVYQGIDQSKLVPLLTKAIQEQQVLIEQLQAEVALLKGE